MPYALFCDDAKVSKSYPSQADVWQHASDSGLVIEAITGAEDDVPRRVLDKGYEIRACAPEPGEDPERNEREAQAARDDQPVPNVQPEPEGASG
ncbi:hypothetical protein [Rhodopseudomonas parapalustris]